MQITVNPLKHPWLPCGQPQQSVQCMDVKAEGIYAVHEVPQQFIQAESLDTVANGLRARAQGTLCIRAHLGAWHPR